MWHIEWVRRKKKSLKHFTSFQEKKNYKCSNYFSSFFISSEPSNVYNDCWNMMREERWSFQLNLFIGWTKKRNTKQFNSIYTMLGSCIQSFVFFLTLFNECIIFTPSKSNKCQMRRQKSEINKNSYSSSANYG